MWVLASLAALLVWGGGFVAGARKASRRALKMRNTPIPDDYGQQYIPHLGKNGEVWYEVLP